MNTTDIRAGFNRLNDRMRSAEFVNRVTHGTEFAMPFVLRPRKVALAVWQAYGSVPREVVNALRSNQREIVIASLAMKKINERKIVLPN